MTAETGLARMQSAERLMAAFSKVPEQTQPLLAAMMECMLVGADLAQVPTTRASFPAPPLEGAARPGAGGGVWGRKRAGRLSERLSAGRSASAGQRQEERSPGGDAAWGVKCVRVGHGKKA